MKRAKITLTAVAVLAVIGGALAFKANRNPQPFYALGTTTFNGAQTSGCVVATQLGAFTVEAGGVLTPYSISVQIPTTSCQARVSIGG